MWFRFLVDSVRSFMDQKITLRIFLQIIGGFTLVILWFLPGKYLVYSGLNPSLSSGLLWIFIAFFYLMFVYLDYNYGKKLGWMWRIVSVLFYSGISTLGIRMLLVDFYKWDTVLNKGWLIVVRQYSLSEYRRQGARWCAQASEQLTEGRSILSKDVLESLIFTSDSMEKLHSEIQKATVELFAEQRVEVMVSWCNEVLYSTLMVSIAVIMGIVLVKWQ